MWRDGRRWRIYREEQVEIGAALGTKSSISGRSGLIRWFGVALRFLIILAFLQSTSQRMRV